MPVRNKNPVQIFARNKHGVGQPATQRCVQHCAFARAPEPWTGAAQCNRTLAHGASVWIAPGLTALAMMESGSAHLYSLPSPLGERVGGEGNSHRKKAPRLEQCCAHPLSPLRGTLSLKGERGRERHVRRIHSLPSPHPHPPPLSASGEGSKLRPPPLGGLGRGNKGGEMERGPGALSPMNGREEGKWRRECSLS
jgi:hypothetical protein